LDNALRNLYPVGTVVRPIEEEEVEVEETRTALHSPQPSLRRLLAFWPDGSLAVDLPEQGALSVGRGRSADVRIEHPSISRRHARLHVTTDDVTIEDLGSANGISVGANRLSPGTPARLPAGAVVGLGAAMLVLQSGTPEIEEEPPTVAGGIGATHSKDPAMERLNQLVELVSKSMISVLLRGETGVGKEVMAIRIHELSTRSSQPLVKLNCAALPDALLESELFGYERGAFTGANQSKTGLLEAGQGGTVFLDEVGDMPLATQAKLLRAIEAREVLRLGALKPRPIDVRFVAATNRDLEQLVGGGQFRADLYFRLNGISIVIPPLRDRKKEIPEFVERLVRDACEKMGRVTLGVAPATLKKLEQHPWPGNIRELRNVIDRAVVLCADETIQPEHVILGDGSLGISAPPAPRLDPATRADPAAEREAILRALQRCNGNQTQAAGLLGISRRTLLYRLDSYGIPRPRKR
jgi:DNA-binding NtrC family response regulator